MLTGECALHDLSGLVSGRTPHIHFKVFLDSTSLVTGQLYFLTTFRRASMRPRALQRSQGEA